MKHFYDTNVYLNFLRMNVVNIKFQVRSRGI